ncbi:hypothetical protein SEMRO_238_G095630.1 [Seminavis robusta]|uniref:Uncharacterized protein n=1 Tax=Seminavis robusta TaxID=568900 RepID=A0A9N8HCY9_9STRA|nr:hypothetical protein SEMRO_238_G095630.1 [Seminavis robusta]|eukprot:Sro238_g095630.1 n/a (694) ;mRNA; r:68411-70492
MPPPFSLNLTRHMEWSIIHTILWDYALAGSSSAVQAKLVTYAQRALADAHALPPDSILPPLGYASSIWNQPYIFAYRPPDTKSWLTRYHLKLYSQWAPTYFPLNAQLYKSHTITLSNASRASPGASTTPLPLLPLAAEVTPGSSQETPHSKSPDSEATTPSPPQETHQPPPASPNSAYKAAMATLLAGSTHADPTAESPASDNLKTMFDKAAGSTRKRLQFQDNQQECIDLSTQPDPEAPPSKQPKLSDDSLPIFNPLAAHSTVEQLSTTHPWAIPAARRDATPLPPSPANSTDPPAFLAFSQLHSQSTALATEAKPEAVQYFFSHKLMATPAAPTRDVVRIASFFTATIFPDSLTFTTCQSSAHRLDPSNHIVPGFLEGDFLAKLTAARGKDAKTSTQVKALQTCLKQQAREGARRTELQGPICRCDPTFFDTNITQAIQNMAFRPASMIVDNNDDLTDGSLSVFHFIRSLHNDSDQASPRIPAKELQANALADIAYNMFFLFHLFTMDWSLTHILSPGHSPFSRFSILGGQLLFFADIFKDRSFQNNWATALSTDDRLRATQAAFAALDQLFDIFYTWHTPKFAPDTTFLRGCRNSTTNFPFLIHCVTDASTPLQTALLDWRTQLGSTFTIAQLQQGIPRDGFFSVTLPDIVLPSKRQDQSTTSRHSNDSRSSNRQTTQSSNCDSTSSRRQ